MQPPEGLISAPANTGKGVDSNLAPSVPLTTTNMNNLADLKLIAKGSK